MHILLVNDDGIESPGILELAKALSREHRLTVCAPVGEQSAVSHGFTLRKPLVVKPHQLLTGIPAYAVSGTPADCTRIGLEKLAEGPVDLVVSGINNGENVAQDILYSGTVAVAMEAAGRGTRAIAVSAPYGGDMGQVAAVFQKLLSQLDVEKDVGEVLNVNIPALPAEEMKGVRWVPQSRRLREEGYFLEEEQGEARVYRLCPSDLSEDRDIHTDRGALNEGYVTLTPLTSWRTDEAGFAYKSFTL